MDKTFENLFQEFEAKDKLILEKLGLPIETIKLKPAPTDTFLINYDKKSIAFVEPEIHDNYNYIFTLNEYLINLYKYYEEKNEKLDEVNFISLAQFLPLNIILYLNLITTSEQNPVKVNLFLKKNEYEQFQKNERIKSLFEGAVYTLDEAVKRNLIEKQN